MQAAMQRGISCEFSAYFQTRIERCRAKAATASNIEDQAYWVELAGIWSKLAERDDHN
jgi:hypothetical protein